MAFEVEFFMVAAAPSLSHAALAILDRVYPMGMRMTTEFCELGGEGRRAVPEEDGWEAKVDAWPHVFFCIFKPMGPSISVKLTRLSATTLRVKVHTEGRELQDLYNEGRLHDEMFYVPLFQIALALDVRAGVGDFEVEDFEPTREEEIEQAIWRSPQHPEYPSRLGFLRPVAGMPKPQTDLRITERPEGFWLLEHPSFLRFLAG